MESVSSDKYRLKFYGEIGEKLTKLTELSNITTPVVLTYGGDESADKETINKKYGILSDLSYHKEIYQPGCVDFKVSIGDDTKVTCKGFVSLEYGSGNKFETVAKYYYIFERRITKSYLYCKAYSIDKFLYRYA